MPLAVPVNDPGAHARAAARVLESRSAVETEALGGELAAGLAAGGLVLLRGELGAGKTTLARGMARAMGVQGPVTSPTFTIGQRYAGGEGSIAHLDLYRVRELGAEEAGLLDDYLDGSRLVIVEWPPEDARELGHPALVVSIAHAGGDRRRIEVLERGAMLPAAGGERELR